MVLETTDFQLRVLSVPFVKKCIGSLVTWYVLLGGGPLQATAHQLSPSPPHLQP